MTLYEHNLVLPRAAIHQLCARYPIRKLSLFGSVLRSDFSPQSDIDILVEFQPRSRIGLLSLMQIKFALQDLIGRNVDLRTINDFPQTMQPHILQTAETLYVME